VEIRDLLNFDLPIEQWREYKASEIKQRIGGYNASAEQVGKVLRKLAAGDKRIIVRAIKGVTRYLLPQMGMTG